MTRYQQTVVRLDEEKQDLSKNLLSGLYTHHLHPFPAPNGSLVRSFIKDGKKYDYYWERENLRWIMIESSIDIPELPPMVPPIRPPYAETVWHAWSHIQPGRETRKS